MSHNTKDDFKFEPDIEMRREEPDDEGNSDF